jgi:predicted nucleotidyltransferase
MKLDEGYKIILAGITGSRSYGLDTPESDTDIRGVWVAPTDQVLGIFPFKESIVTTDPDVQIHEVSKFIRLALKPNPACLELLWLDFYIGATAEGKLLLENRRIFLSDKVRYSFGGYALDQAKKLTAPGNNSVKKRGAKHARYCMLLLDQLEQLLTTANLTIRVSDERKNELLNFCELPLAEQLAQFEVRDRSIKKIEGILPSEPDVSAAHELLLEIRHMN